MEGGTGRASILSASIPSYAEYYMAFGIVWPCSLGCQQLSYAAVLVVTPILSMAVLLWAGSGSAQILFYVAQERMKNKKPLASYIYFSSSIYFS